jgi:[protein-PII] uridylyltransferase
MLATSLWNIENNTTPAPSLSDSAFYRQALDNGFEYLRSKFEAGEDIDVLVKARAHYVDQVLQCLWQCYLPEDTQVSLLAVGGYGRAELHPYSDIDLLVLLSESASDTPPSGLTQFITQLWDIGLEIGQSVRTLEECRKQAAEDITIATNLLEVRLLCGDVTLFEHLQGLTQKNKAWDTKLFFEKKKEEQRLRHSKYNNTANNLEPNIKESPGGLRDIQVINWVAQQHFDVINLEGLNTKSFITDAEYNILEKARHFLWRVRFGLHILAGRKQENLLIDHQRELAEMLGYKKTHNRLAVEHFMKEYYLCARSVRQLNELLLQLFDENIIDIDEPQQIIPINRRFQTHNGYLETSNSGIFAYYPYAMLELILLLQQNQGIKGLRADTIRQIHAHIYLINDQFRADIKSQSLFMEIIRQPNGLSDDF